VANSTDEYWSVVDSFGVEVSLSQFAWAVTTHGGSAKSLPSLRGSEPVYALRPGQEFRPKIPEAREISLSMFVNGADPTTEMPSSDEVAQFNMNWAKLQDLFWTPERQITLIRRWRVIGPDGDSQLRQASALAQIVGSMEPRMRGRSSAVFVVDLLLSDPFFYGEDVEVVVSRDLQTRVTNTGSSATTGFGTVLTVPLKAISVLVSNYEGVEQRTYDFLLTNTYYVGAEKRTDIYSSHWMKFKALSNTLLSPPGNSYSLEEAFLTFHMDRSMAMLCDAPIIAGAKVIDSTPVADGNSVVIFPPGWKNTVRLNTAVKFSNVKFVDGIDSDITYYVVEVFPNYSGSGQGDAFSVSKEVGGDAEKFFYHMESGQDAYEYTSVDIIAVETPVTGLVTTKGATQFLVLYPGTNALLLTRADGSAFDSSQDSGPDPITLTFRVPYV
jgi:hypothetical protein